MSDLTFLPGLRFHILQALRVGFLAGLVGGCAPAASTLLDDDAAEDDADEASALGSKVTRYVGIEEKLPPIQHDAWDALRARLFAQFDDICGDTFCEGDWSNLEPLDLTCSATATQGKVRECVWTFAASDELVEASGGAIQTSIPFFTCRVRPNVHASKLVEALRDDPLYTPLPGLGSSLYDAIGECFESASGAIELDGDGLDGVYGNARDGLDETTIDAWYAMTSALRTAYAEDFGSEAGAPEALRFVCSEDTYAHEIGDCSWSFADAEVTRRKNGLHRVKEQRHVCTFRPEASPFELATALTAEGDLGPLDRPIPGGDVTMRDVLEDCW